MRGKGACAETEEGARTKNKEANQPRAGKERKKAERSRKKKMKKINGGDAIKWRGQEAQERGGEKNFQPLLREGGEDFGGATE